MADCSDRCPYCNSASVLSMLGIPPHARYRAACMFRSCDAVGPWRPTPAEARTAWIDRASVASFNAGAEAMRGYLADLASEHGDLSSTDIRIAPAPHFTEKAAP